MNYYALIITTVVLTLIVERVLHIAIDTITESKIDSKIIEKLRFEVTRRVLQIKYIVAILGSP